MRLLLLSFLGPCLLLAACAGGLSDPEQFYLAADGGAITATSTSGGGGSTSSGGTGTGGSGGSTTGSPPPNCDAPSKVFAVSCLTCHAQPTPLGSLDLGSPNVNSRLVNVQSHGCPGHTLVVPGQPSQSYLLNKLNNQQPASCGAQMPLTGLLDQTAITCVSDWIANLTN